MFRDLKEVRDYYATLRELFIQNPGGWDDADLRAKVEGLCSAGIAALDDDECREWLRAVRIEARDLFSRDRHLKWTRKSTTGADYLRLKILFALEALNTRLRSIETLRNRELPEKPGQDLPPAFEH